MQRDRQEHILEFVFLIALFGSLMLFIHGNLADRRVVHDFPYTYFASDGVLYLSMTQYLAKEGNERYHPWYHSAGYPDVLWVHGTSIQTLAVMFSSISGIPVYDALSFMLTLFIALNCLAVYVIMRAFNKKMAMIGIGLYAFIFTKSFYVTYLWGQVGAINGMLFMTGMIWWVTHRDLRHAGILLIIMGSAAILGHMPEFLWGAVFIAFFYMINAIIIRKWEWASMKKTFMALVITCAITAYYLLLFFFGAYASKKPTGTPFFYPPENLMGALRIVLFTDWGPIIMGLIVLGAAFAAYQFFVKKKSPTALIMGVFFLVLGFANYFGAGPRVFHIRAFWPLYLAPLVGIAIYILAKTAFKQVPTLLAAGIGAGLFVLIVLSAYQPIKGPGVVDGAHWDAFQWIAREVPDDQTVFLFYGDTYSQSARLIPKKSYLIQVDDYATALSSGQVKREYRAELLTSGLGDFMFWNGTLAIGHKAFGPKLYPYVWPEDICAFDYYVFDMKTGYAPALIQLNLFLRDLYLKSGMSEVYHNEVVSILKNNNRGGNCFAQINATEA